MEEMSRPLSKWVVSSITRLRFKFLALGMDTSAEVTRTVFVDSFMKKKRKDDSVRLVNYDKRVCTRIS